MKRPLIVLAVATGMFASGLVGFFVGKRSGSEAMVGRSPTYAPPPSLVGNGKTPGSSQDEDDVATPEGNALKDDVRKVGRSSMEELLEEARRKLAGGMINIRQVVEVFQSMEEIDPKVMPELLRGIEELPNFQQKNLLFMAALTRWAEVDGEGAATHVRDNMSGERQGGMLGAVFSSWASKEPEDAWNWFEESRGSLSNPMLEAPLMRSLFQGVASKDLDDALAKFDALDSQHLKNVALDGIGSSLSNDSDRRSFLKLAATLDDRDLRMHAMRPALGQWAHGNPDAAAAWLDSAEVEESERREIAKSVRDAWFQTNPEDAADWYMAQIPEDDKSGGAVREVVQRWMRQDPNAAGEWLGSYEPGPGSDEARASFSQGIAGVDPASAVSWAKTITNDKMREQSLTNILRHWYKEDPVAAGKVLNDSGLSAERMDEVKK